MTVPDLTDYLDLVPWPLAEIDEAGVVRHVNPAVAAEPVLQQFAQPGQLLCRDLDESERSQIDVELERVRASGTSTAAPTPTAVRIRCSHLVWIDVTFSAVPPHLRPAESGPTFLAAMRDASAEAGLREALARAEAARSLDAHTGLANRESLLAGLAARLGAAPAAPAPVGVLFCDIDHLKRINDRHGHLAGDAVITTIAQRLKGAVRRNDLVSRVGGDEFVILVDGCRSVHELRIVAGHVHAAVSWPVPTAAGLIDTTITIGGVLAGTAADADQVLAQADAQLYRAKRAGRDRVRVDSPA